MYATLSDTGTEITNFMVDAKGTYVAQLIVNDGTIDSKADNGNNHDRKLGASG